MTPATLQELRNIARELADVDREVVEAAAEELERLRPTPQSAGTPEMVERVCAAIQAAMCDVRSMSWKPDALMVARAAIASLREPTEAMMQAGMVEIKEDASWLNADDQHAGDIWRAMIDAALAASEAPATQTPETWEKGATGPLSATRRYLALLVVGIHDAAHDAWNTLHKTSEVREHYPCMLCGEVMFRCMDYTHAPTCPSLVLEAAIDAYGKAIDEALSTQGGGK